MLAELGVCLSLASNPSVAPVFLPIEKFTLAWTHSIEKIRWEEDYSITTDKSGKPLLVPGKARILGTGAGMEPPADAVLTKDGWYEYQPKTKPLTLLKLTRSPYTADYDWCVNGKCQILQSIMPTDGNVTLLKPCKAPDTND